MEEEEMGRTYSGYEGNKEWVGNLLGNLEDKKLPGDLTVEG
jgi:hypothetical protein